MYIYLPTTDAVIKLRNAEIIEIPHSGKYAIAFYEGSEWDECLQRFRRVGQKLEYFAKPEDAAQELMRIAHAVETDVKVYYVKNRQEESYGV